MGSIEDIIKSIVLGIVQGLTEFLPVSSSGHEAIANAIMAKAGLGQISDFAFYMIITHMGTMFATLWIFWDDVVNMLKSLLTIPEAIKTKEMNDDLKMVVYIVIASIPTVILGFIVKKLIFTTASTSMVFIGVALVVTGTFLLITRFVKQGEKKAKEFGIVNALIVGVAQGIATVPGISRSGTTISTALMLKSDREFAGRFSFLMSLPVIFAASVLEIVELFMNAKGGCPLAAAGGWLPRILAFLVAFGMGYLFLKLLLKLVKSGKFYIFAIYCYIVGITTIILGALGIL